MGLMSRRSRRLNFSSFHSVAGKGRTGTESRPKEMAPDQIERGTASSYPQAGWLRTMFGPCLPGDNLARASPPDGGLGAGGPLYSGPRRVLRAFSPVENPVDGVERREEKPCSGPSGENAHAAELGASGAP